MTCPNISLAAGVVMIVLALSGCGDAVGPESGMVKFDDGSPVTAGSIEFRRASDGALFASRISPDGTFRPTSEDGDVGLPPGTFDVVVVQIVLTEDLALEDHTHGHTVPREYADYYTSDLSIEVTEGETQPVEIVVKPATPEDEGGRP